MLLLTIEAGYGVVKHFHSYLHLYKIWSHNGVSRGSNVILLFMSGKRRVCGHMAAGSTDGKHDARRSISGQRESSRTR